MLFRSLTSFLFLILFSFPLYAAECLDIFPALSQNYGPQLNLPNFKYSSENDGDREGGNLAIYGGQYKDVKVDSNGSVYFAELNTEYRLKKLELGQGAIAQFVAGDYWIEDFKFEKDSTLTVNGGGTVRIYVGAASFEKNAHINDANGLLIFISYSDFSAAKELNFTGVMYAQNNIALSKDATIIGSITGGGVSLGDTLSETYQETSITNADFNGMCDSSTPTLTPIANYRFDECAYTGVAFDAFDQTGNYSATSQNSIASTATGIVERAANISDFRQHFTTSIPLPSDFTVSTWFKKPTSTSDSNIFVLGAMQNGGDLLVLDRNNGWYWGIYDGTNTVYSNSYSFASLDDNWHHMVLIYQSGISYLVIDGIWVDTINRAPSGTLKYIGSSLDSIGTSNAQGFRAPLDEFMVFNQTLSLTEIQTIYNNQLADKNYDGSTRTTVTCNPVPIANYRFDECTYTGIAADTIDQMANYAATSHNSMASTSVGVVERAADITNHEQHFTISIALPADFTISTWFKKPTSTTGSDYFVLGAMEGGGDLLVLDRNNSWRWGIYNGSNTLFGSYSFETEIQDNNWHHMALMYQSGISYLVIDGIWVDTINIAPSGTLKYIGTSFDSIGTSDAQGFRAPLDEFMVFNQTLSLAEMQSIYNNQFVDKNYDGSSRAAVSCTPVIDHYLIEHNGQGLTCETERVAVRACTNVYDGSTCVESSESISLDLVATGGTNSVSTTTAFVGSTIVEFNYTVAETIVLSTANESISASNTTICNDNSSGSCNMVFANAGFRFLNGSSDTSEVIANQIAGTSFPIRVQAVEYSNGVCIGVFTGDVDISLSQQNVNPGGTSGQSFQVGGVNLAKYPSFTSNVTLNFGTDSIATLPSARYLDAGNIGLHASYADSDVSLVGSSEPFWVRPNNFAISAQSSGSELNGNSAISSRTHEAGASFDFTVTAYNSLGSASNNITENYQQGQIQLKLSRILPNLPDSIDGDFTYASGSTLTIDSSVLFQNTGLTAFNTGKSVFSQAQFSEVGIINIDVQDINYGGQNWFVESDDITVGRFRPDHFEQTIVESGSLMSSCNLGATTFAYSGQLDEAALALGIPDQGTIEYLIQPIIAITAYNANGGVTENYYQDSDGSNNDFMKLDNNDIAVISAIADNNARGIDTTLLSLSGTISTGELSQDDFTTNAPLARGTVHYKLSDSDYFYYLRSANTQVQNFQAEFDLTVSSISDGEASATVLNNIESLTGVDIRFGRMVVENSYGPETSDLLQVFKTEYYDGSKFVLNTDDKCTTYDDSKVSLSNISLVPTSVFGGSGSFSEGISRELSITAPGAGNIGEMGVTYSSFDWLQFDWDISDTDTRPNQNPTAVATFGVFRGNDRIISWREVGN
jgi:MSHA biogenesis protein MshQ